MAEIPRQFLHLSATAIFVAGLYLLGLRNARILLFLFLTFSVCFVHLKLIKKKLPGIDNLIAFFGRHTEIKFPGKGVFWFALGVLTLSAFLTNINEIAAGIIALGVGDGISGLVHPLGKYKIPFTKHRTVEGSIAFFIAVSLVAFPFVGLISIPLALVTSLIEAFSFKADDNFTIPLAATIFFLLT